MLDDSIYNITYYLSQNNYIVNYYICYYNKKTYINKRTNINNFSAKSNLFKYNTYIRKRNILIHYIGKNIIFASRFTFSKLKTIILCTYVKKKTVLNI
jgi:hypothetical protein